MCSVAKGEGESVQYHERGGEECMYSCAKEEVERVQYRERGGGECTVARNRGGECTV